MDEGFTSSEKNNESKEQKFRRLAERRMNSALEQIKLIGNLSDRRFYKYSEIEYRKLRRALWEATNSCFDRYEAELAKTDKKKFKFDLGE